MALVHEVNIANATFSSASTAIAVAQLPPSVVNAIKLAAFAELWKILILHKDDKHTFKVWIFTKTVRLEDLFPILEHILGPRSIVL